MPATRRTMAMGREREREREEAATATAPRGERRTLRDWLRLCKYRYELNTALYMLEPWERMLFNGVLLAVVAYVAYGAYRRWYAPILSPWISTIGSSV